jgi:hypothetical protein
VTLFARPVADERDGLLTFFAQQRDALPAAVLGLTDAQARLTPTASTLSLGRTWEWRQRATSGFRCAGYCCT